MEGYLLKNLRILLYVVFSVALFLTTCPFFVYKVKAKDESYYFVELKDKSIANYKAVFFSSKKKKVLRKLNLKDPNVVNYKSFLLKKHSSFGKWLKTNTRSKICYQYFLTLNGFAIKATEEDVQKILKNKGVKRVVKSSKYYMLMNRSHGIINTASAFRSKFDGLGVKVAVIDSGIDQEHPFLKNPRLEIPKGFPKIDRSEFLGFTNNKVIAARVYGPDPNATPQALDPHGTHVAGIIAGKANFHDKDDRVSTNLSGVAPRAQLGNYNVFPCGEESPCYTEGIHIAAAVEDAVNDGMDVANLSLGGKALPRFDLLEEVVNSASKAGMIVVVAAGNSGPKLGTISSPAIAENVLTVGAVTNIHFFSNYIRAIADGVERLIPIGSFYLNPEFYDKVEATAQIIDKEGSFRGCSPLTENLTGKIAIIQKGGCDYTVKVKNAISKGALGVVVVNDVDGDPVSIEPNLDFVVPVVMVSKKDGQWLLNCKDVKIIIERNEIKEFESQNGSSLADFSSRGPTIAKTLKPDVVAPGVDVYSSVLGNDLRYLSGTSMATPHVTGAVALLLQAHPDWKIEDIKAALVGTGRDTVDSSLPIEIGGGIIDIGKALKPVALAYPSSISFGVVSTKADDSKTIPVTFKNSTASKLTYRISCKDKSLRFSQKSITLGPLQQGTIDVTVYGRFKGKGHSQGYINFSVNKDKKIRVPFYYYGQ